MLKSATLIFWAIFMPLTVLAQGMENTPNTGSKISNYDIARAIDADLIANFPLDEVFLTKMEHIRKEMANLPVEAGSTDSDDDMTLNGMTRAVEARPQLVMILEKYDMTPRDYVVGALALSNALAAAMEDEEISLNEEQSTSAANLTFGKNYTDRIRALYAN